MPRVNQDCPSQSEIKAMIQAGLTQTEIARRFNVSISTVNNRLKHGLKQRDNDSVDTLLVWTFIPDRIVRYWKMQGVSNTEINRRCLAYNQDVRRRVLQGAG